MILLRKVTRRVTFCERLSRPSGSLAMATDVLAYLDALEAWEGGP